MPNLIYPKKRVLLSSIGKAELGVFSDTVEGDRKLVIKKEGIVLGNTSAKYVIESTKPFVRKVEGLELLTGTLAAAKEVSIKVNAKYKTPGYIDNSEYWQTGKTYGKNFAAGTTEDQMIVEIMNQITTDVGFSDTKNGAIVEARKYYIVTDDDNDDASTITVTIAGVSTTITSDTFTVPGCLGIKLHATAAVAPIKAYLINNVGAVTNGVDTYLITSEEPGLDFTITAGADTTVEQPRLLLESKQEDLLFSTEIDEVLMSRLSYTIADLYDAAAFANAANMSIKYSTDAAVLMGDENTAAGMAEAIIDDTSVFGIAKGLTTVLVGAPDATKPFSISFPFSSANGATPYTTTVELVKMATANGSFSSLTADDVQRVFATADHAGDLTSAIRRAQTEAGASYTRIFITSMKKTPGLEGANHVNDYVSEAELYVKTDLLRADLWNSGAYMEDSGATKNAGIIELLEQWV